MTKEQTVWEEVGEIGVDAGLCWVGDPCYCVTPDAREHPADTWSDFCSQLGEGDTKQWNYKLGHAGLGVSANTGYGDGVYPVLVSRNDEGRIAELKVIFIE